MYNLFVSASDKAWHGEPYVIEVGRCVRQDGYTDAVLAKRFGDLSAASISKLRRFPSVFAYEAALKKDPKFGALRQVTTRRGKARIEYEIITLPRFLTGAELSGLTFELDILEWELNRNHWAVKDVDLAKELRANGISLPNWALTAEKAVNIRTHKFDVALSFPGEIRDYVEAVASAVERNIGRNSCFYDKNYVAQLAGPGLDVLLQDIFANRSKLIVVFLCGDYQNKEWCGIEFRPIREIIMKREHDKVMFVRMDDGHVEGVFKTDGYVDGQKYSPEEVARFIQDRVNLLP